MNHPTDNSPITVTVPRNVLLFFADVVGGSGPDWWGDVARHYGVTVEQAHAEYERLHAAANRPRCISCNADLAQQGDRWVHAGTPGCDALIVPEYLQ